MTSLADLQSSPDVGRSALTVPICLAGKLAQELEDADQALFELLDQIERLERVDDPDGPRTGRRPKIGQRPEISDLRVRATEAAEHADGIRARMEKNTIVLTIGTKPDWRDWCTKNPARTPEDDPAGARRDRLHTTMACNLDALIAIAGEFITKYGADDPQPGAWEFVAANASEGDKVKLASTIVRQHEQGVSLGKSRKTLLTALRSETAPE